MGLQVQCQTSTAAKALEHMRRGHTSPRTAPPLPQDKLARPDDLSGRQFRYLPLDILRGLALCFAIFLRLSVQAVVFKLCVLRIWTLDTLAVCPLRSLTAGALMHRRTRAHPVVVEGADSSEPLNPASAQVVQGRFRAQPFRGHGSGQKRIGGADPVSCSPGVLPCDRAKQFAG